MAIKPSAKSTLTATQLDLDQKIFAPADDNNYNINLGNVKAAIVAECTSAASDGVYNATVLNNIGTFKVYNGLIVTCRFTYANTVTNPRFMINNLGSAPLHTSTTAVGSGSWKANAILQLQYCAFSNGDAYWLIVGSDSASEVDGIITNANGTTIYNKQTVDSTLNSALVDRPIATNVFINGGYSQTFQLGNFQNNLFIISRNAVNIMFMVYHTEICYLTNQDTEIVISLNTSTYVLTITDNKTSGISVNRIKLANRT